MGCDESHSGKSSAGWCSRSKILPRTSRSDCFSPAAREKTAQIESATNAASVHSGMLNESSVQSTAPHSPDPRSTRLNPRWARTREQIIERGTACGRFSGGRCLQPHVAPATATPIAAMKATTPP